VRPLVKKILPYGAGFFLAVILVIAIYLYFFRSAPSRGSEALIRLVPEDAGCIIESSGPADMLNEFRRSSLWKDFMETGGVRRSEALFRKMDTLLISYPHLKKTVSEYPAVAGIRMAADSTPSAFLILEVPSKMQRATMRRFIGEMAEGMAIASAGRPGKKIHIIKNPSGRNGCYYAFVKNCLVAGNDSILLCGIMEQARAGKLTLPDETTFAKVYGTIGKKVSTHLFLNTSSMKMAVQRIINSSEPVLSNSPCFPDGWSAFDVTIKNNDLIFNGFTALREASSPFGQLFLAQVPEDITIQRILPYNTVFSFQTSTGDFRDFSEKMKNLRGMDDTLLRKSIRSLRDPSVSIDLEKRMESIAGPEICLAFTGSADPSREHNTYIILRSAQLETGRISLNLMSDPDKDANIQVGGHMIQKLIIPNPYVFFYGFLPDNTRLEWFTILDDHIVFGETQASIHRFLSFYLSGRTMASDPSRSAFLDYFPERSNLSFNINVRFAGDDLMQSINDSLRSGILLHKDLLNRFEGLAVHLSAINDMFYTTVHLNYDPSYAGESPYLWKVRLDEEISGGPFLIEDPSTGKGNVVVFDQSGQMVLIDENGMIRWKRKLSGPVLSDVFRVDPDQDHQPHLLCNTSDSIYLLNFDGHSAAGFPLAVPSGASNGLTVLDYNRDRNYRIILVTRDRRILNLDITGNSVKGWNSPVLAADVVSPVKHLVAAGKDYLIFPQQDGTVLMTDRKGNIRLKPDKSFRHSNHAGFYAGTYPAPGIMYSTDINGNVVYITGTGTVKKVSFGDYLPDHSFVSADFNMDKKTDYIFLDRNRVTVLSQNRKPIAEVPLPEEISHPPLVFELPARSMYLGFYSAQSGNIYLLSKEGQVQWVSDIKSDHPFQIGHLTNKITFHLISGYRDEVFNYLFE
jgi:hypothetical protein